MAGPPAITGHHGGRSHGVRRARWTHIALPVQDLDRSLDWYERFTPLELLDRRDDDTGEAAWLGHSDQFEHPFILVLVSFDAERDNGPRTTLAPFAHLGIEVPDRRDVDRIAEAARAEGCLHWPPAAMADPIGYLCAITDPDGNVIEISHDQGVYAKAREVWGPTSPG
jgi:lactoylglutathione lyase